LPPRLTDDSGFFERAAIPIGLLVLALYCSVYLLNPRFISHETDWLQYPARYRFARECWLKGAPPLWCHYFGGGYFIAGDPDGQTLTLITPFVLIFGEIVGLKVALIAAHLVAAAGMYYLMRHVWRQPRLAAAFSGLLLSLSTWLPGRIFQGNWPEMYFVATPWLAALYLRAKTRPKYAVALGLVLGLILPQARQGWAALVLFLAVFGLIDGIHRRRVRLDAVWIISVAAMVALLVGAVKLVPASKLFACGLPLQASRDLYSPASITALHWTRLLHGTVSPEIDIIRHQSSESCVGYVGAGLALLGLVLAWRKAWKLAVLWCIFAWLAMSWRAPFDLFHYLHSLPVFGTMMNPIREFRYFLVFAQAAVAGLAVARCWDARRLRWVAVIVCMLTTADVLRVSLAYRRFQFTKPPPASAQADARHQVYCLIEPRWAQRPQPGNAYFNMLRGVGTVNYHTSLALPEYVEPKTFVDRFGREHENSHYRGEVYALATGARAPIAFPRPNSIAFDISLSTEDTVVLNQNHDPGWSASVGQVTGHHGRLAVRLPAGKHTVRLHYRSVLFPIGAAVSIAALVATLWAMRSTRRRVRRVRAYGRLVSAKLSIRLLPTSVLAVAAVVGLALALRPRIRADRLVAEAVGHMDTGAYTAAAELLAQAEALRPDNAAVLRRLGTCRMQTGQASAGFWALIMATKLAPDDADTALELLTWVATLGDAGIGRKMAVDLKRQFPLRWQIHFWEAVCLCRLGELAPAEESLFRAIELGLPSEGMIRSLPPLAPLCARPAFDRMVREIRARQERSVDG